MAQTVSIILRDEDRKRLEAIAADRSCLLKHIAQQIRQALRLDEARKRHLRKAR